MTLGKGEAAGFMKAKWFSRAYIRYVGGALSLGDLKGIQPERFINPTQCKQHKWMRSKYNQVCTKCGFETDKDAAFKAVP